MKQKKLEELTNEELLQEAYKKLAKVGIIRSFQILRDLTETEPSNEACELIVQYLFKDKINKAAT